MASHRYPCSIAGPVKLHLYDYDTISVGRGSECFLILPEDMFEEEENLKYNKESFHINYQFVLNT